MTHKDYELIMSAQATAAATLLHALVNALCLAIIVGLGAGAYCAWRNR